MGKIRPILFNTDMVRAIRRGRKHATRRIAKKIPVETHRVEALDDGIFECHWGGYQNDTGMFCDGICTVSALYQTGDILYVRETWREHSPGFPQLFIYKADYSFCDVKWKPGIHMPKEAARIWLKVTDVRAERLQDIDDSGIMAEGLEIGCDFENIWNNTVKKPDMPRYGWEANPWVWVIEFKRCEKPEKGEKQGG